MLNEFFSASHRIPPGESPDMDEHAERVDRAFKHLLTFLKDPDAFYNPTIQDLVTTVFPYEGPSLFRVAASPQAHDQISFNIDETMNTRTESFFLLPWNMPDLVRTRPLQTLFTVVEAISYAHDFWNYRLDSDPENGKSIVRGEAYAAELLHTISQMALEEEYPLRLTKKEEDVMRRYPAGVASIAPDMLELPDFPEEYIYNPLRN